MSSSMRKWLLLKPLLFLTSVSLFLFLYLQSSTNPNPNPKPSPNTNNISTPSLHMRPGYASYDAYLAHQLDKTLNPRLRHLWATRDWDRKIRVFSHFFSSLRRRRLLSNSSAALCIGARLGQEVAALRSIGVADAVGIDLVPSPPLVVEGDFHRQPFPDGSFDFEFSNVFDHALYPDRFVGEIERTLRPGGVCVLHVALKRKGDKYSANDLDAVEGVTALFRQSELVEVREVDGFGLDTEVVLRKKRKKKKKTMMI